MKRLIAIVFLSIYLLSTSQWDQFAKLPVVFQHYREHLRMEGKISFLDFLKEHYVHSDPADPDYARDMQLPFKMHSHCLFMLIPAAKPKPMLAGLQLTFKWHYTAFYTLTDNPVSSDYARGIFQPPRFA